MKNVFEKIAAIVAVATMSIGTCAVPVSAETSSEYYKEIGEQVYAKVIKTCEYDENNFDLIRYHKDQKDNRNLAIDTTSDDFLDFVKNAEKSDYVNKFSNGEWYLITYHILGEDENDNVIISDYYSSELKGFDENNNPIAVATELFEEEFNITYGITDDKLADGKPGKIRSTFCRWLIKFDENGEPVRYVPYNYYEDYGVTRTVDLHSGEDIIIDFNTDTPGYKVLQRGDANLDTKIDIKDVAKYAQHIVKLSEIPNYADIVADMNEDNSVDIKDLTLLKKQLIGE